MSSTPLQRRVWTLAPIAAIAASLLPCASNGANTDCNVLNLMPAFWHALASHDPANQMRTEVIDPHPDLYNENYVAVTSGESWQEELARDKTYVEDHRDDVIEAERYLLSNVPDYMQEFQETFADYRCDFTFYIAPSFGHMDGSAATCTDNIGSSSRRTSFRAFTNWQN
jgi:hypothetical protein